MSWLFEKANRKGSSFHELFFLSYLISRISYILEKQKLYRFSQRGFPIREEFDLYCLALREDPRWKFWEKIESKHNIFPSFSFFLDVYRRILRFQQLAFLLHLLFFYPLPIIPTAQQKIRATRAIETERGLSRATKLYDLNKRQRKSVKNNPKYSRIHSSPPLSSPAVCAVWGPDRDGGRGDRGSGIKRVLCAQVCTSGYALFCQQRRSYQHARYNLRFFISFTFILYRAAMYPQGLQLSVLLSIFFSVSLPFRIKRNKLSHSTYLG